MRYAQVHRGGCKSVRLFESESGTHRTGLVLVSEVCAGRYGAGRVRARCERDEEGIVGGSSHGASAQTEFSQLRSVICERWSLALGSFPPIKLISAFPAICQGNQPASRRRKSLKLCRTDRRQYVDPHAGQLTALACACGLTPWRTECRVAIIAWWSY